MVAPVSKSPVRTPAAAQAPSRLETVTVNDFVKLFSEGWISVKDLQERANAFGRGPQVAKAIAAADLDGDGKISGEKEARALFKALDAYDHDGSKNTLRLHSQGLREWLAATEKHFHAKDEGWAPPVSGHLAAGGWKTSQGSASSDTLSPVQNPGSTLVNGQRLNRRYIGSGPVEVATKNGRVGAFQYTGGMNVDTDGGTSRQSRSDRYYQSRTSMKWGNGKSLDADKIPYIVLPPSVVSATGAKLGDLVEIKKNGKTMYAIYGDAGPNMKLGEGSMMLAKSFDSRAGPNNGIESGVTTTVLPGSGARFGLRPGGPERTAADIQSAGQAAFAEARADGVVR